eukprot:TRINITY_DN5164_c0_g1_i1.p1 TRINITY_DN5164_c0_g1~~TRINITY_DN5164_c0_g1_i1.p1  ORF type:complete len:742 (-),score=216.96 TRINITY_DN5164_c0_g1_i1:36-2102(-)
MKQTDVSTYFPAAKTFAELPLSPVTLKGLEDTGYRKMTAIQRATLAHALCGRDVLAAAQTGSGKTLAFLIPVLELLWRSSWNKLDGLGALILTPTRELALQTFEVLRNIGKYHLGVSAGLVIGGGKNVKQEADAIGSMMILVSTPGRLLQHMDENPRFNCDYLKILVLDEADRILDMGFGKELDQILNNLPQERQTLLFSATQTTSVSQLARLSLQDPEYISVHANSQFFTPTKLSQFYMICPLETKTNLLWSFIRSHLTSKMMIFFSSQKQVRYYFEAFRQLRPGMRLLNLHGKMSQQKRMEVYWSFHDLEKQKNIPGACLLCTDIAARGLDFKGVDWVIQADCPEDTDTYIHRAGRTARMNKDGSSLLLLLPSEEKMAEMIKDRKIPLEKIDCNPEKQQNIIRQLQATCLQDTNIKLLAQKAVRSYVRGVSLMANKDIFKADELPVEEFSQSLGLVIAPKLPVNIQKVDKNKMVSDHRQSLLAAQAEEAEKEGLSIIPVKYKKKQKTNVERLMKRKNVNVLSDSAFSLVHDEESDDEGDSILRKKEGPHIHTTEDIDKLPVLKKQKDFVSLDDVDMPLDNKGDYISRALRELKEMDESDKKRNKDRVKGEKKAIREKEKLLVERPMPTAVLGTPGSSDEESEEEESEEDTRITKGEGSKKRKYEGSPGKGKRGFAKTSNKKRRTDK